MERERLLVEKPTAQVRILSEEFLSDGKVHSRKQLVDYAQQKGREFGLPPFKEGHLAGGIREALANLQCEKLGRGTFRATLAEHREEPSCWEKAADVCAETMQQLTAISREIDYVNASERELQLLMKVRECVQKLQNYRDEFRNY